MGTNFYCAPIPTKERTQKVVNELLDAIELIRKGDTVKILDTINGIHHTIDNIMPENVHIGKLSIGNVFLWDYHKGKYFKPALKSILEYLKDKVIFDENGEQYDITDFINTISDRLYANGELGTGLSIGQKENQYYFITEDGLRFAKFEDFS